MDLEALRRRLDAALSRRPRLTLDRSDLVSAAVLVPVTDHGGPHLVFTKKTSGVPHHKGQFSFPGGVVETSDGSRVETALREAWEEIRLPAEAVEVLGLLDDTPTRATNFVITPVVGIVGRRAHGRRIVSGRGSAFWLCALASRDPAFAKYPRLPVLRCAGHQPKSTEV
jgi:8-oxo-dGTP pyrophosphatase MutT (NUDIX family)